MSVNNISEKLANIVSKEPSKWLEEAKWRAENRSWLKLSQSIALNVLNQIDILDISQKDLAVTMGVSPQLVNKWVKGKENLTLETITKLEHALGIQLINIQSPIQEEVYNYQIIETPAYKPLSVIHYEKQSKKECNVIPFMPIIDSPFLQFNNVG